MAEYLIQGETLTEIADAIRAKNGTTETLSPEQMATAVESIQVGVDTSDATASVAEILSGETAYINGEKVTGAMVNNGAVAPAALSAGGSYTIPEGYHNGSGKVTAQSLATITSGGTVTSGSQILSGYKAYSDGTLYTGTMANQGAKTATLNAGGSYTIPAGYHNGSGKVTVNSSLKNATVVSWTDKVSFLATGVVKTVELGFKPDCLFIFPHYNGALSNYKDSDSIYCLWITTTDSGYVWRSSSDTNTAMNNYGWSEFESGARVLSSSFDIVRTNTGFQIVGKNYTAGAVDNFNSRMETWYCYAIKY